jgi:hypothetical protein
MLTATSTLPLIQYVAITCVESHNKVNGLSSGLSIDKNAVEMNDGRSLIGFIISEMLMRNITPLSIVVYIDGSNGISEAR